MLVEIVCNIIYQQGKTDEATQPNLHIRTARVSLSGVNLELRCWCKIWHVVATEQTIPSDVDRDLHIMNIWRFVCRSVAWWHLMIGRHWVRSQSLPQCGYSFFWITPVSPAACRALLFCLHSWFALKQSRLNSVFNCPSKTWTYDPMIHFRRWFSGCRFESSLISIFWPDFYIILAKT